MCVRARACTLLRSGWSSTHIGGSRVGIVIAGVRVRTQAIDVSGRGSASTLCGCHACKNIEALRGNYNSVDRVPTVSVAELGKLFTVSTAAVSQHQKSQVTTTAIKKVKSQRTHTEANTYLYYFRKHFISPDVPRCSCQLSLNWEEFYYT